MFHITKFTLSDRITLLNVLILKLKIYCGPDKFYGPSKFGQYDKEQICAPFISSKTTKAQFEANAQKFRNAKMTKYAVIFTFPLHSSAIKHNKILANIFK